MVSMFVLSVVDHGFNLLCNGYTSLPKVIGIVVDS